MCFGLTHASSAYMSRNDKTPKPKFPGLWFSHTTYGLLCKINPLHVKTSLLFAGIFQTSSSDDDHSWGNLNKNPLSLAHG